MSEQLKSDRLSSTKKETDATLPSDAIKRPGLLLGAVSLVGVALVVFNALSACHYAVFSIALLPLAIVLGGLAIWRGFRGRYLIGFRLGIASLVLSCGAFILLVLVQVPPPHWTCFPVATTANSDEDATALKEFLPLAEQGHADSQYKVGVLYGGLRGHRRGVPQDIAESMKWFHRAADQNHALAQFKLCFFYNFGTFVPQNDIQAYKWCHLAALGGNKRAQHFRDAMITRDYITKNRMTPAQIRVAHRLAREWLQEHVD